MIYPRVHEVPLGMLRPVLTGHAQYEDGRTKDLTGLLSCKFWMYPVDVHGVLGTVKVNGAAGAIVSLVDGELSYTWTGTDTNALGRYRSYFIGYWGAGSTIPEYFKGPEVIIYPLGSKVTH